MIHLLTEKIVNTIFVYQEKGDLVRNSAIVQVHV